MATRTLYWIGGSGNWSDPAHWSLSSGGAGGEAAPDSDDDVHFDAASNATAYTVTIDSYATTCKDFMVDAAPSVSGTVTFNGDYVMGIKGSIKLLAGMTLGPSTIQWTPSSGSHTIQTNGVVLPCALAWSYNGTATFQLLDDLTLTGVSSFGLVVATASPTTSFDTNGFTITLNNFNGILVGNFSVGNLTINGSASKLAAFSLYNSGITVTGTLTIAGNSPTNRLLVQSNTLGTPRTITAAAVAPTNCDFQDITGAGAATWEGTLGSELIATAADRDFSSDTGHWAHVTGNTSITGGVLRFNNCVNGAWASLITAYTGIWPGKRYAVTFTISNYSAGSVYINLGPGGYGVSRTANGTYTEYLSAGQSTFYFAANVNGTTLDIDNVSIKEADPLGNCLGNSGIGFGSGVTNYWYTTTTGTKYWSIVGNWFLGSGGTGGAGRVPLPQDTCILNGSSIGAASTTISADMPRLGKDINWSGVTNSPAWSAATPNTLYGSLTLGTGMTFSCGNYGLAMLARSAVTLTCNGVTIGGNFTPSLPGGTLTLGDALLHHAGYYLSTGFYSAGTTINTAGYAVTCGTIVWNGQPVTWNLSSSTIAPFTWQVGANCTVNPGTSVIKFTDASASTKQFISGGKTYNQVWLAGAGSGAYHFTGSPTISELKVSDGAKTIKGTTGTTITVATVTGGEDNAVTINTVSGAGQFTFTKSGGSVVKLRGANITNCIASPAATWYAGATGVDGGNNVDWTFNNAPATGSASITTDDAALVATGVATIAGAAAIMADDVAQTAAAAVAIVAAAAITTDDTQYTAAATAAIVGAAAIVLDDTTHAATGAVAIAGSAAITTDDDFVEASGYVWRLINDARYLHVVASNRNVGPVKGIQL